MDEFKFIDSIKQKTYRQSSIIKGIGDDAAVFRQPYMDIVTAVDTFVENVHFSIETMTPYHVGYRVLAANISDMAAMGAIPAYYMISIVVPTDWPESKLKELYQGMNAIALAYQLDLIGGDTVSGEELVVSVTIIGFVDKGKVRYRSIVQDQDVLFVTGTLGDASAGLELLLQHPDAQLLDDNYFVKRHRMPTPRIAFAQGLSKINRVALNDISDGIASEANELAEVSDITLFIDYTALPIHKKMEQFSRSSVRQFVLNGGEDFELVGTVSLSDWEKVKAVAEQSNTIVTKIGYASYNQQTNGSVFLKENGKTVRLNKDGYKHRS